MVKTPKSQHLRGQRTALTLEAWPTSLEAQELRTFRHWGWLVFVLTEALLWAGFFSYLYEGGWVFAVGLLLLPLFLYVTLAVRKAVLLSEVEKRVEEDQRARRRQALEADAAQQSSGALTLATVWALNNKRLDDYHDIARDQARTSFRSGQTAMAVGLLLVVAVGVALIVSKPTGASAIAFGAIGVSASAMTTYIAATFLRAQTQAQAQLGQFFIQPVETARLLSAERLVVSTLAEEDRKHAVQQIVASIAGVGVLPTSETLKRPHWWSRK